MVLLNTEHRQLLVKCQRRDVGLQHADHWPVARRVSGNHSNHRTKKEKQPEHRGNDKPTSSFWLSWQSCQSALLPAWPLPEDHLRPR
eukprot:9475229-Pyramimonas_sp.AAC.1